MAEEYVTALIEAVDGSAGEYIIRSPMVGVLVAQPTIGMGIPSGGTVGAMVSLNRCLRLVIPESAQGIITELFVPHQHIAVAFEQQLFRIGPMHSNANATTGGDIGNARVQTAVGEIIIRCPTDGIFYRRSDPASPAYVEIGSTVKKGQTLGLVEVMKCFNHIQFVGKDIPETATVTAIMAPDTSEVKLHQVMFRLSPGA